MIIFNWTSQGSPKQQVEILNGTRIVYYLGLYVVIWEKSKQWHCKYAWEISTLLYGQTTFFDRGLKRDVAVFFVFAYFEIKGHKTPQNKSMVIQVCIGDSSDDPFIKQINLKQTNL